MTRAGPILPDEPAPTRPDRDPPRRWDVCNGDADGLCALHQWRLEHPGPAVALTGLKREIELLRRIPDGAADEVNVFDLSMRRNRADLVRLLAAGVRVRWFDHHATPPPPDDPRLDAHLDARATVCTSLLVDRALGGRHRGWALVGAYGDALGDVADALARASGFDDARRGVLRCLGETINYNAYGERESDVPVAPSRLLGRMAGVVDPLRFAREEPLLHEIERQRRDDLAHAASLVPHWRGARACAWRLPDAPWSRRAIGPLANALAVGDPGRAHAVLRDDGAGGYVVSVRAPRAAPRGADELCARFGGDGRAGAAGIDRLPASELDRFLAALDEAW